MKMNADRKYIWHPCSQMMDYEKYPAIHIERGEGVWLIKKDGTRVLDAISSWWTNLFGHGNRYIASRLYGQAKKLEHVIFANYTHTPAIELAKHLAGLFDGKLGKVFFADNGSSAVEAALKMSFHYWRNVGKTSKTSFACIKGAYHGETLGALSVGSLDTYKKTYKPLLLKTVEIEGPDCFRCPYGLNRKTCSAECFEKTEKVLERQHKKLAAFIIEPICQAANGMAIYSPVYLKKLSRLCKQLDIHLICDEIAVGFGRTGKMMASHHAGIVPDFVTVSKGLTGGFLPMSAVLTKDDIYDAFYAPYVEQKAFMHSHSYTGNPLAATAGCAVFELFRKLDPLKSNVEKGEYILDRLAPIREHKNVGEVRSIGMITAVELVKDRKTREAFDWRERVGYQVYRKAERAGVLLRPLGDVIYFMPPYVIGKREINIMTDVAVQSIRAVLG